MKRNQQVQNFTTLRPRHSPQSFRKGSRSRDAVRFHIPVGERASGVQKSAFGKSHQIGTEKRTCIEWSGQLLDCRLFGSYPETAFEEVKRLPTKHRFPEPDFWTVSGITRQVRTGTHSSGKRVDQALCGWPYLPDGNREGVGYLSR
jgi:hypothetical protein